MFREVFRPMTQLRRRRTCVSRGRSSARTQLAAALGQPDLRIYDCTTYLEPTAGQRRPVLAVPGRKTFEEGHVAGADFLDLQGEFSDQATRLRFMMPATAQSRRPSAVTV